MAHTTLHKHWSRRTVWLFLGALTMLGMAPAGLADEKKKDENKPIVYARVFEIPKYVTDNPDKFGLKDSDFDTIKLINDKILAGWKDNKIQPSRPATEFEFARRAYLDIIGRIPTFEEIKEYLKIPAGVRRAWLVNKLLESDEYPRHWSNLWANWSLGRAGVFGTGMYKLQLQDWFKDELAANAPYDEVVKKLLTASGRNTENGAVNFTLAHVGEPTVQGRVANAAEIRQRNGAFEMVPLTSRVTRLFLGIQTQCTQCHDHPFDANLKQEHFWGINAFLRQVEREGQLPRRRNDALQPLTLRINTTVNTKATIQYEKRNGVLLETKAKFLPNEGKMARLPREMQTKDRRPELVKYLLAHNNFSKAGVNRMWGAFLGRGFVNPMDDFNDNNQPSHPELLDELGKLYKHYGYNQKQLIRWITLSDAYNLGPVANETNDKVEHEHHFSRMLLKQMSPEQLFESMMIATRQKKPGEDSGELRRRWLNNLVTNFGDDEGNEITFNGTIVQSLLMMNGQDINAAVTEKNADKGTVAYAMKEYPSLNKRIRFLYLSTVNRLPSAKEEAGVIAKMKLYRSKQDTPEAQLHDLMWALLNSNEFILNH